MSSRKDLYNSENVKEECVYNLRMAHPVCTEQRARRSALEYIHPSVARDFWGQHFIWKGHSYAWILAFPPCVQITLEQPAGL